MPKIPFQIERGSDGKRSSVRWFLHLVQSKQVSIIFPIVPLPDGTRQLSEGKWAPCAQGLPLKGRALGFQPWRVRVFFLATR